VVVATLVPALLATVLYCLLLRFIPNATRIFWIAGLALLALSLFSPFGLPVAPAIQVTLALMHVVAGISILGFLTR
jgi:hypothetical protein